MGGHNGFYTVLNIIIPIVGAAVVSNLGKKVQRDRSTEVIPSLGRSL